MHPDVMVGALFAQVAKDLNLQFSTDSSKAHVLSKDNFSVSFQAITSVARKTILFITKSNASAPQELGPFAMSDFEGSNSKPRQAVMSFLVKQMK